MNSYRDLECSPELRICIYLKTGPAGLGRGEIPLFRKGETLGKPRFEIVTMYSLHYASEWFRLGLGALGDWILQPRAIEMGTCGGPIEAEEENPVKIQRTPNTRRSLKCLPFLVRPLDLPGYATARPGGYQCQMES